MQNVFACSTAAVDISTALEPALLGHFLCLFFYLRILGEWHYSFAKKLMSYILDMSQAHFALHNFVHFVV